TTWGVGGGSASPQGVFQDACQGVQLPCLCRDMHPVCSTESAHHPSAGLHPCLAECFPHLVVPVGQLLPQFRHPGFGSCADACPYRVGEQHPRVVAAVGVAAGHVLVGVVGVDADLVVMGHMV